MKIVLRPKSEFVGFVSGVSVSYSCCWTSITLPQWIKTTKAMRTNKNKCRTNEWILVMNEEGRHKINDRRQIAINGFLYSDNGMLLSSITVIAL